MWVIYKRHTPQLMKNSGYYLTYEDFFCMFILAFDQHKVDIFSFLCYVSEGKGKRKNRIDTVASCVTFYVELGNVLNTVCNFFL